MTTGLGKRSAHIATNRLFPMASWLLREAGLRKVP
jgi:hypothetical protein